MVSTSLHEQNRKANELSYGLKFYFYPHLCSLVDRERIKIILDNIKGKKVLDAGSGRGNISLCVWKAGYDVVAVDLSRSSLNEAAFLFRHERAKIPLIAGSITDLPLDDKKFDTIICTEVIEHIPDACKALSELRRVLKNDGRIIVSVPNAVTFGLLYDHILAKFVSEQKQIPFAYRRHYKLTEAEIEQFGWRKKIVYRHCQDFTFRKIKSLLNSRGFKIRSTRNIRFLSPYIRSCCTLLGIRYIKLFERIDIYLAKHIPYQLASDWIFVCKKMGVDQDD